MTFTKKQLTCYGWTGQTHAVEDCGAIYGLGMSDAEAIADALTHCPGLRIEDCYIGEVEVEG